MKNNIWKEIAEHKELDFDKEKLKKLIFALKKDIDSDTLNIRAKKNTLKMLEDDLLKKDQYSIYDYNVEGSGTEDE